MDNWAKNIKSEYEKEQSIIKEKLRNIIITSQFWKCIEKLISFIDLTCQEAKNAGFPVFFKNYLKEDILSQKNLEEARKILLAFQFYSDNFDNLPPYTPFKGELPSELGKFSSIRLLKIKFNLPYDHEKLDFDPDLGIGLWCKSESIYGTFFKSKFIYPNVVCCNKSLILKSAKELFWIEENKLHQNARYKPAIGGGAYKFRTLLQNIENANPISIYFFRKAIGDHLKRLTGKVKI